MLELNQQEYSEYIQNELVKFFPEFSDFYRFEEDIYIVEYPSLKKQVTLWISAQDCELSLGLDQDGECIWHTHMSLFGAYEPEDELKAAVKLINGIFTGKEIIVFDSEKGIYMTDEPLVTNEIKNKIELKIWNDL